MNGERILIVDDEADIALIIKLQLEDAGYKTVRARDGVEALEHIGRENFALILLDIKMPRMDGLQVLARIQEEQVDAAVVMMTAHGSEDIAVEAMKRGAIDYIAKPFSTEDMVKKVERAIQLHRTRQENLRLSRQLEEERQKMEAILQGMADVLLAVDREGRIMTVNRKAESLFGVGLDKLVGTPVEKVLQADIPPERLPSLTVLRSSAPCIDVAYNIRLKKGLVPVLASATPLLNGSGELIGSVEIIRDISALKALEQEREDFVTMLSHDLKSPITAIVGSLDLVREGRLGPINEEQQEYLESSIESCSEMVDMIDTLLDIHRFDAGKMVLAFKSEESEQLIQKIVTRFRPVAKRADLQLFATVKGELSPILVDRTKFIRLLSNLLTNALKFTPSGGEIEITAEAVEASAELRERIPVDVYPERDFAGNDRFLMIAVRDTGTGIAKDDLAAIFDRFVQARSRRMGKAAGSGLGLTFCRKVMDAHQGYIWAESTVGKGSTFFLLFPLD
jgi:two-component system, OmpR family, phosphate regulon sensor histidine kinase PhoR